MDDILTIILKDTYSLTQLKHRVRVLKTYLLKTFFTWEESKPTSQVDLNPQDLSWMKSLPNEFYQKFNKDNVYQIFADLEKKITSLQTLTMYLTFEPDDATLSQIGSFARKSFGINLLLDIKIDPNLIAGTALVWRGIYKDYSLKVQIENRKSEILESFRKFLR